MTGLRLVVRPEEALEREIEFVIVSRFITGNWLRWPKLFKLFVLSKLSFSQ